MGKGVPLMKTPNLSALLQHFFTDRLITQMEASPNTIAGYRDTFRLLLRYASQRRGKAPTKLQYSPGRDSILLSLCGDERARLCLALPENTDITEQTRGSTADRLPQSNGDGRAPRCTGSFAVDWPARLNIVAGRVTDWLTSVGTD